MSIITPPPGTRCSSNDGEGCPNEADAYVADLLDMKYEPLCRACVKAIAENVLHECDCGCLVECPGPLDGPAYVDERHAHRDEMSATNRRSR